MKYILTLMAVFTLAACSSTGIVPKGDGTYTIEKKVSRAFSGSTESVKNDIYQEAVGLCAGERKAVETIELEITPESGFRKPGNVSLQFRCK